jgi:hypothetical protein
MPEWRREHSFLPPWKRFLYSTAIFFPIPKKSAISSITSKVV